MGHALCRPLPATASVGEHGCVEPGSRRLLCEGRQLHTLFGGQGRGGVSPTLPRLRPCRSPMCTTLQNTNPKRRVEHASSGAKE